ncbi:MAG: helix-turn-helix domain-containing protein [Clostridia bacterium]|nr:helix-turn-helix domain-containing protein [Clostridia bacterium]
MSDEKLGDKIYDLRMSNKLSQDYLAIQVGVTRQTISKWEANASQPKSDKLRQLCKAFNVEMNYLMPTEIESTTDNKDEEDCSEPEVVSDELSSEQTNEVVADKVEDVVIQQETKRKKRKLSKKAKIVIISVVIAIVFLVGLSMIIIDSLTAPPSREGSFGGEVKIEHNFSSIENIGWIIFSVSLSVAIIMGIVLILYKVKRKNIIRNDDKS